MKPVTALISLIVFPILALLSSQVWSQHKNPDKLRPCTKADYPRQLGEERNTNGRACWGRYVVTSDPKYKNGVYEGEFVNGKFHGFGIYQFKAGKENRGDRYVGNFRDGQMTSNGTYYFANGEKYIGNFEDGQRSGYGTQYLKNGDRFSGEWKYDQFHGFGKLTFPFGEVYEGHFAHGITEVERHQPLWQQLEHPNAQYHFHLEATYLPNSHSTKRRRIQQREVGAQLRTRMGPTLSIIWRTRT